MLKSACGRERDERAEVLPFLILWPALIVLMLLLVVHAFIVTGARSQAEAAASAGLRAAWHAIGTSGLAYADDGTEHTGLDPPPRTQQMVAAAHDAVARSAAAGDGWRWWTPGAATVRSDWCHSGASSDLRPAAGEHGWVRVEVTGEVFGPFSALWPGRLDRVHAAAAGPAVLTQQAASVSNEPVPAVPVELPEC
ncbi:hypothetical protein [Candidatus Poriferisodalis sp.]|uniref:hypothetical protein n=1 Tax=Candidatus Poriferisodalis sp. TaxID=3101277 RepID=UPI003B015574